MTGQTWGLVPAAASAALLLLAAALLARGLIALLAPLLVRYALARPNARSAHRVPTPQGGGIAVLLAALAAAAAGAVGEGLAAADLTRLGAAALAALVMAGLGLVDDVRPLPALPRLVLQILLVGLALLALPEGARVLPLLPRPAEAALLVLAGTWFVNLVNFMDGMDWMTVVEMVPVTLALVAFSAAGYLSAPSGLLMLGLAGGLIGFAPANQPVARLFLGDVGSLPIGLLVALALFDLAAHGGLVAALLLPLYYLADATLTLLRRLARRERVWEAHREHFYQLATAHGFTVRAVLVRVAGVNILLCALAALSLATGALAGQLLLLALGAAAVALLLAGFARGTTGSLAS